jgi:hypothetical protein
VPFFCIRGIVLLPYRFRRSASRAKKSSDDDSVYCNKAYCEPRCELKPFRTRPCDKAAIKKEDRDFRECCGKAKVDRHYPADLEFLISDKPCIL